MPVLKPKYVVSSFTCTHCPAVIMAYIDVAAAKPEFTCKDCKAKEKKKKDEAKKKSEQCLCYPCWKARYCRDHACNGCKACTDYVCGDGRVHHTRNPVLQCTTTDCVVIDRDEPEVITYVDLVSSSSSSSSSSKSKKKGIFSFIVPGAFPAPSSPKKKKDFTSTFHIYKNETNGIYTEFEEYAKGKLRPVRKLDPESGMWVGI